MKTTIAALSLLLLVSASPAALAQDEDRAAARAEAMGDREPSGRMGRAPREAPRAPREFAQPRPAPDAPRAREAPVAPSADGDRRRAEDGGRGGGWIGRGVQGRRPMIDTDGDHINDGLTGADRQDREDRDELRQRDRWIQGQTPGPRPGVDGGGQRRGDGDRGPRGDGRRGDGDRRGDSERGGPRGDNDRRGDGDLAGDRRWDGDRDGRRGDGDRRWENDRRRPPANHPRWDGRRYPHSYSSRHRFRGHFWTPPLGFYVRVWNFGDHLPRGWYESNYRILDWWSYNLPVPPPGYVWVRVRDDAVLIDEFNGRVVQVVRSVFW